MNDIKVFPIDWEMHEGLYKIDIVYWKDKICHNIAFKSIQPKRFDRKAYYKMISKIISMDLQGKTLKTISQEVNRSPERIRQIKDKFYRRLKRLIEKDNQP